MSNSNAIITIQTQYQENYSNTEVSSWRNKGGHTFKVTINSDVLMYGTDNIVPHLELLLKNESNDTFRYLYLGHEVSFFQDTTLSQADLEKSVRAEYDAEEKAKEEAINNQL